MPADTGFSYCQLHRYYSLHCGVHIARKNENVFSLRGILVQILSSLLGGQISLFFSLIMKVLSS